jgi:hypothetical protein
MKIALVVSEEEVRQGTQEVPEAGEEAAGLGERG